MRPFREVACFDALSAYGSIRAGQAAKAAGNYNAAVATNNAIAAEQAGSETANRLNTDSRRKLASATAAAGASGGDLAGSTIDVLADSAAQLKLEEETARWMARTQSASFLNQAVMARFAGKQALTAGYIQAGSTLLTSAAKAGAAGAGGA